jgi:Flp pilus assembly CpaE family ATPase
MMPVLVITQDEPLLRDLYRSLRRSGRATRLLVLREYPRLDQIAELIRTKRPGAVLIDLASAAPALSLIRELAGGHPDLPLVATRGETDGELILAAVRAGATRYVKAPFDAAELHDALHAPLAGRSQRKGRLTAVVTANGGSGGTTVAAHLAAALAQEAGSRVLLMDLDFQCSALDFRLQIKPEFSLADALERGGDLDELWDRITTRWKDMEVLGASQGPFPTAEMWGRLRAVLASASRVYDWVVADLPPSLQPAYADAVLAADHLLLVATPEPLSLHLARRKMQMLRDLTVDPQAIQVVLNRADGPYPWKAEEVAELLGVPPAWTLRNDYTALAQSCLHGTLVPADRELSGQFRTIARALARPCEMHAESDQARSKGWRALWTSWFAPRRLAACSS